MKLKLKFILIVLFVYFLFASAILLGPIEELEGQAVDSLEQIRMA